MRNWLSGGPSPATAIAFVALLVALSGTAVALPSTNTVDSGDIKNGQVKGKDIGRNAVTGAKIKNGTVKSADVGNDSLTGSDVNEATLGQVPSANSANSANTANSANNASHANNADSASTAGSAQPVAFAQVASDGTVVAANSKGVTNANVTRANTGAYCITGLAFDIKGGAVNTIFTGSNTFAQFTEAATGFCPNGGQVLTKNDAGTQVDQAFHVVLYG